MNGLLIGCQVEKIATRKDKTVSITLGTQELSPANAGALFSLQDKMTYCYLRDVTVEQNEVDQIDKLDPDLGGKTQSKRIRDVLFRVFQSKPEGFTDFNKFYHHHTEKIINHLKTKIDA